MASHCWVVAALAVVVALLFAAAISIPAVVHSLVWSGAARGATPLPNTEAGNTQQYPTRSGAFTFAVTLFNVTNPRAVTEKGAKPVVEEVGPFMYTRAKHRLNVSWDIEGDTFTFREWEPFSFDREETVAASNGRYDDDTNVFVTNVDLVFLGSMPQTGPWIYDEWYQARLLLDGGDETDLLFTTQSVRSFVTGYHRTSGTMPGDIRGEAMRKGRLGVFVDPAGSPGLLDNFTRAAWERDATSKLNVLSIGTKSMDDVLRIREWLGEENGTRPCPWGNIGPLKSAVEWCPGTMWPGSAAHPGFPCCGEKLSPVWGTDAASRARGVLSGGQLPPSMLTLGRAGRPTRISVWAPSLARSIPLINTGEVGAFKITACTFRASQILLFSQFDSLPSHIFQNNKQFYSASEDE